MSCGSCTWWFKHVGGRVSLSTLEHGECRRFPPTAIEPLLRGILRRGTYPTVSSAFPPCGEWEPRGLGVEPPAFDKHGEPR